MSGRDRRSVGLGGSGRRPCIKTRGPARTGVFSSSSRTFRVLAAVIGPTEMHKFAVALAAAAATLGVLAAAANVPCTGDTLTTTTTARFTGTRGFGFRPRPRDPAVPALQRTRSIFPLRFSVHESSDGQNELITGADGGEHGDGGDDGTHRDPGLEHEQRGSIAVSFGPVVDAVRRYRAAGMAAYTANEMAVPDTVIVGNRSDTYLTSVRVKGLRDVDGQFVVVSWKEDSVSMPNNARNRGTFPTRVSLSFRSRFS